MTYAITIRKKTLAYRLWLALLADCWTEHSDRAATMYAEVVRSLYTYGRD